MNYPVFHIIVYPPMVCQVFFFVAVTLAIHGFHFRKVVKIQHGQGLVAASQLSQPSRMRKITIINPAIASACQMPNA